MDYGCDSGWGFYVVVIGYEWWWNLLVNLYMYIWKRWSMSKMILFVCVMGVVIFMVVVEKVMEYCKDNGFDVNYL